MLAFHRGTWEEAESMPNDWQCDDKNGLIYPGFNSYPQMIFGDEQDTHVSVYYAEDMAAHYRFLVLVFFETFQRTEDMLVTDFPSLIQLLRDILPLVNCEREREAHEVLMEEHRWRVEELGKRRECCH